jgi:hypothetical protein
MPFFRNKHQAARTLNSLFCFSPVPPLLHLLLLPPFPHTSSDWFISKKWGSKPSKICCGEKWAKIQMQLTEDGTTQKFEKISSLEEISPLIAFFRAAKERNQAQLEISRENLKKQREEQERHRLALIEKLQAKYGQIEGEPVFLTKM